MRFKWWIPFLALTPAAFVLYWLNIQGSTAGQLTGALFVVSLLALIPLAEANGQLVKNLAKGAPKIFSGLLNALLGNVPEIAIGVWLLLQAIRRPSLVVENYTIIHGLLLGSVIENILFTLGAATLIGALRHGKLKFSRENAAGFASMLGLAVVGLALPTLATNFADKAAQTPQTEQFVSLVVSGILLISYIAYIAVEFFGFGEKKKGEASKEGESGAATVEPVKVALAESAAESGEPASPRGFGAMAGLLTLTIISVGAIAGVCATMVTVSDQVITTSLLTPLSFGLIVLPIITNFGELLEAAGAAFNKDMEGAMGVAAGSSVQVPLFVTPVLVFVGSIFAYFTPGLAPITLIFQPLGLITLGLAAFVYALVNLDGETTWLEGAQLIAFYTMIGVTAFALPGA